MEYYIKFKDLQNLRTSIYANATAWESELQQVQFAIMNIGMSIGMKGDTAVSINSYIKDVHGTIIKNILQLLSEYIAKIAVYEQGYFAIDSSPDAEIAQAVLETKQTEFQSKVTEFDDLDETIKNVLEGISDICYIPKPADGIIKTNFQEIDNTLQQLKETVGTYEDSHLSDCDSIKEYMNTIQAFISGQSGKGRVIISTYRVNSLENNLTYLNMKKMNESSVQYSSAHKDEVKAVNSRMSLELEQSLSDHEMKQFLKDHTEVELSGKADMDVMLGNAYAEGDAIAVFALADWRGEKKSRFARGELSAEAGKVEIKGTAKANLLKGGTIEPSLGVNASAEANGIRGTAKGQLGTDHNNGHIVGEGTIGYAKAEIGANVGKHDDGKFGVSAEIGAEAAVVKGEVKAGWTIFGITIDASLEGKVLAVGAGANAEIKENEIELGGDLSAILGMGFDISISW